MKWSKINKVFLMFGLNESIASKSRVLYQGLRNLSANPEGQQMHSAFNKVRFLIWLTVLWNTPVQGAIEIVELDYLDAKEATELLKPMMRKGESVSGAGGKVFVDAGLATQEKVRKVLNSFDTPPENLLVSIRKSGSKVNVRESGNLVTHPSKNGMVMSGNSDSKRTRVRSRGEFSGQVINGDAVYVETGKGVLSMSGKQVSAYHGLGRAGASSATAEVGSRGLWISPKVKGDEVTVRVGRETISKMPLNSNDGQDFAFVVNGQIGEWLSLERRAFHQNTEKRRVISTGSKKTATNASYEVKVERFDR